MSVPQKPRLTYVISHIDRWVQFEWIAEELRERGYSISFILLNAEPGYFEKYLEEKGFPFLSVKYRGVRDLPQAFWSIRKALIVWRTQAVHCHFLWGSILGLAAARWVGVPIRIHSRHHAEYHHHNHPKAVWYDRFNNRLSTHIIAISEVVREILIDKEAVPTEKIIKVHHGFQLENFAKPEASKVECLRKTYRLEEKPLVIGVVSRFIEWKGVATVIDAFKILIQSHPEAILVLANARGPEKENILKQLQGVPDANIRLIEFEKDLFSLFRLFDIFVHCPVSRTVEAFGQVYIEAAASQRPCVFTRSGIANEAFRDKEHAYFVDYQSPQELAKAVQELADNPQEASAVAARGQEYVLQEFSLGKMIDGFERVYVGSN